jgi:tRNA (guanine-N7-)-methyltransferase
MGQKKLIKFAAIKEYENVLEYPQDMQGKWNNFFENLSGEQAMKPLVLELACGRGEYAVGLGRMFPAQNFIGLDIKGNRIWKGASIANKEGLKNIAFVRTQIDQVTNYFAKEEVSEIWITFPDPQLRWSKAKKRLTHPKFLRLYQQFLQKADAANGKGIIHLKTDSPNLYLFTLKVIELYGLNLLYKTDNLYVQAVIDPRCLIKTYYEGKDIAQSNQIHYIQFTLDKDLPIELDEVLKEAIKDIPLDAGELLRMQTYERE